MLGYNLKLTLSQAFMDISQVARQSGLPASTLRYYEDKGLIRSLGRHGLRRVFGPQILDQLALISLGRAAGFSLDEIRQMFTPKGQPQIDRQQLRNKADELDRQIRRLTAMRDGLVHAAACPAQDHLACPKFQRLLNLASAKGKRAKPA
ncbi:helix-turn-helix domain-containing protein [Oceanococcus atlanticus]